MLNGALKIVKLIFMRNFEKPWVICCETEGELEVFPLLVLRQTIESLPTRITADR
jgi:hypothetical protein